MIPEALPNGFALNVPYAFPYAISRTEKERRTYPSSSSFIVALRRNSHRAVDPVSGEPAGLFGRQEGTGQKQPISYGTALYETLYSDGKKGSPNRPQVICVFLHFAALFLKTQNPANEYFAGFCTFRFRYFGGDGGSRTRVQTRNPTAFYTFSRPFRPSRQAAA